MKGFGKLTFIDSPDTKIFVPVKEAITTAVETSEQVATGDPYAQTTWDDPVFNPYLLSKEELKNEIAQHKELHLRPMSNTEYNSYVKMLKDQRDQTGKDLFKYQLAAIARVIKENFDKFFPQVELDYQVGANLDWHQEVNGVLFPQYEEALDKYRGPFVIAKAEEVAQLYSTEERARLRSLGVAFLGEKFSSLSDVEVTKRTTKKFKYQHPMLKYNLIRGKK